MSAGLARHRVLGAKGLGVQRGRGGLGSHKHGVSEHAPKSPRLRLALRMKAEREVRKPKAVRMLPSLRKLLHPRKPKR